METMERLSHDIDATTPAFTLPYNPVTGKVEEPPQPMAFRSIDGPSLSGAAGAPTTGTQSTPDTSAPPPSPSGAPPVAPAAAYSAPAGNDAAAVHSPPSYQPAAYQPPGDSTAVAAASASAYQPPAPAYSAPGVSGYSAPAEYRPQQYGSARPVDASAERAPDQHVRHHRSAEPAAHGDQRDRRAWCHEPAEPAERRARCPERRSSLCRAPAPPVPARSVVPAQAGAVAAQAGVAAVVPGVVASPPVSSRQVATPVAHRCRLVAPRASPRMA
ncbi:hypothetical protein FXN61_48625, partial [Lentzea sp. PSKA42]|nr:hypothetical protein [Lentzea indica]